MLRSILTKKLITGLLCLCTLVAIGQVSPLESLNNEDGLSQDITTLSISDGLSESVAFDVLKDKEGFMWFATRNGLNRYDGYTFKTYRPNSFDSLSIAGNASLKIFEDSKGRLWIGTFRAGLNCFDKKTGRFYRFNVGEKNAFVQPFILSIDEDQDGTIWVGGWKRTLLSIRTGEHDFDFKVTKHEIEGVDKSVTFFSNCVLSDGRLIVGTNIKGMFQWNKSAQRFEPFELPVPEAPKNIFALLEYPKGTLWIGTNHQLYRLKNGQMNAVPTPPEVQKKFIKIEDRMTIKKNPKNNKLWLSYFTDAVYELDPTSETLEVKSVVQFDNDIDVTEIYFDENQIAWIATSGNGIQKIKEQHAFKHLAKGKSVHSIYQTKKGEIYIRSNRKMLVAPNRRADFIPLTEYTNIPTDFILGIKETEYGDLWATTRWFRRKPHESKLFQLGTDRQVKQVLSLPPVDMIYGKILEDSNGDLWFPSLEKDLTKLYTKTGEFESFGCLGDKKIGIDFESKMNFYKDGQGNYWIAGGDGLYRFTMNEGAITDCKLYQNNPNNLKGLNFNSLSAMVDDPIAPDKYLWVATRGGGLNKMDKTAETFEYFGEKDGLPSNVVLGVLSDDAGNLWLSTNKGLSRFNPITRQITNFSVTNGLQSNEFLVSSCFKNEATGELFFGGINGITAFYPENIQLSTFQPKVYISQLKIHGELIEFGKLLQQRGKNPLSQPIEFTEKIRLPWYQNQIALDFASLDFANPEKNLYQYQLSSVDKNWVNAGNRHSVNYTNLRTGTHIFQLRGTNSDGLWSSNEAILKIIIYPPWYRTNWAYTAYVILFILGIYKLYQDQVRRAKLRNELEFEQKEATRLAEMDKIKTNFFSNITHEFRTPLTLIIEPLNQILENGNLNWRPKVKLARRNSQRLLTLVNQLLDLSKLESKKMNLELKRGDILVFVAPIMASFAALAKKKEIELIYNAPTQLPFFDFDKNKVEKILYNLISNAIKFTKTNGTITVNFIEKKTTNELQIQIIDTGIGIAKAEQPHIFDRFYQVDGSNTREHEGTGIGLALSKELAEVMNGQLNFKSEIGKGSTFELFIPMVKEATNSIVLEEKTVSRAAASPVYMSNSIVSTSSSNSIKINPDATNIALVIEDNDELRAFIKSSIEHKYKVIEASNGRIGLELALEHIPNIIISDVMMPIMDGFEVCQKVKTNEKTAHIPIILLTAKTAMKSRIQGLKYGADAYMNKPFSTEELLIRMNNLIELRQQLQYKYSQTIEAIPSNLTKSKNKSTKKTILTDDSLSTFDKNFLTNINQFIEQHIDDENLSIEDIAKAATMSRTQLYRKLRALLNQSPSEFLRNFRLKVAKEFLLEQKGNVTEVAFMVGFSSASYFSTKFKEKYGVSPKTI